MEGLLQQSYGKRTPLKNFLALCRNYRLLMLGSAAMFVVKHSPVWVVPILTANIINILTEGDPNAGAKIISQFAIGAGLIWMNLPTHIVFARMISKITRSIEKNVRSALCIRLQHLSIQFHTNNKLGVLQTKVLRDVENIEMLTRIFSEQIPQVVFSFIIVIGVTYSRAPKFIYFYLFTVPVAVVIFRIARGYMRRFNRDFRENVEDMSGKVVEMLKLIPITRAHNLEKAEMEKMDRKLEQVKDSGMRLDLLNGVFNSLNWVIFTFFSFVTMSTASYLSYKQIVPIKVGDVVLLTANFTAITGAVMQMLNLFPNVSKGLESVRSVSDVLECPDIEKNFGRPKIENINGEFTFEDVSFSYADNDDPALSEFSLKVKPGETIALVGPSGSGKSTLMQLIIGFVRPNSGSIYIDGKNYEDIDLRTYRRSISVVSQETVLFDGSIRDNVTYGKNGVSDDRLQEVIESANLSEFVAELPNGLDTPIKENGARLSGGQRQRLAIARALIRDPKVLVLDEATTALDVESEALIQDAIEKLIKGRTTFIVAHRLSTIRNANRIVVLSRGKIAEIGTHEELVGLDGIYARMVKLQSGELASS